ncbi:hypothetical protein HDU76_000062 [Blyttiomyces sp. JEL0837]|nr:hypothetical protein HDU76_000062 [Blyttiomyces sp. JEL0837]
MNQRHHHHQQHAYEQQQQQQQHQSHQRRHQRRLQATTTNRTTSTPQQLIDKLTSDKQQLGKIFSNSRLLNVVDGDGIEKRYGPDVLSKLERQCDEEGKQLERLIQKQEELDKQNSKDNSEVANNNKPHLSATERLSHLDRISHNLTNLADEFVVLCENEFKPWIGDSEMMKKGVKDTGVGVDVGKIVEWSRRFRKTVASIDVIKNASESIKEEMNSKEDLVRLRNKENVMHLGGLNINAGPSQ